MSADLKLPVDEVGIFIRLYLNLYRIQVVIVDRATLHRLLRQVCCVDSSSSSTTLFQKRKHSYHKPHDPSNQQSLSNIDQCPCRTLQVFASSAYFLRLFEFTFAEVIAKVLICTD